MNRKPIFLLIVALLACLALPAGWAAAEPVEPFAIDAVSFIPGEPNDTFATAASLFINPDYGYFLTPADVDYYRVELAQDTVYSPAVSLGSIENPTPLRVELALFNAGQALVAQDVDCGDPAELSVPLTAGVYYLRVRPCAGTFDIDRRYQLEAAVPDDYIPPVYDSESEPNDTPAQAATVVYGALLEGHITLADPTDYYRFTGAAGDTVAVTAAPYTDFDLGGNEVTVALFDAAMNPMPLNEPANWAILSAAGDYFVRITDPENTNSDFSYHVTVALLTGDEPENDLMATATPVVVGQVITARYDYYCDVDWYRFQGRAGDIFPIEYPAPDPSPFWTLHDAAGNLLFDTVVLPKDGTYYLKVTGESSIEGWGSICHHGRYQATAGSALWVSVDFNGLGPGGKTSLTQQDIVTRDTAAGKWKLVFDASDVGITRDVTAIEVMPNGSILMSLDAGQNVPGLGWVAPQDIIRFVPASLGETTAGTFQWYLDGSDVGLTTAGEKIDAIRMQPQWADPLRISTFGSGSVPQQSGGTLNFADEDLINFVGAQYGANSAGKWRMNFDGSTIPGVAGEDLSAVARVELTQGYLSPSLYVFRDGYSINGIKGDQFDVLSQIPSSWQPEPAWRLVVTNLTNKAIDAIAIGTAWRP